MRTSSHERRAHRQAQTSFACAAVRPRFRSYNAGEIFISHEDSVYPARTRAHYTSTAAQTPRSRQAPAASTESYESADIDGDGNLRILTSDRRTIVVPKGGFPKAGEVFGTQTAFENPFISEGRRAVGAQAMFVNCCTSYDIPLQLVIYSGGKTHRFEGGLAIFDWHFADRGRRVVFSQETVHFACSVHWELRDIASERLLAAADIPEQCAQIPDPPKVNVPQWVTGSVSGFR